MDTGNTGFMMICAALVFIMTPVSIPGGFTPQFRRLETGVPM